MTTTVNFLISNIHLPTQADEEDEFISIRE